MDEVETRTGVLASLTHCCYMHDINKDNYNPCPLVHANPTYTSALHDDIMNIIISSAKVYLCYHHW